MNKLLSWIEKSKNDIDTGVVGYCYVPDESNEPISKAEIGATIRNATEGPPWIVVDQSLNSIVVAKWPGRLWKLRVIHEATEQPNASATYVRAVAIKVLEELSVSVLFGEHGRNVVNVIESARHLDVPKAIELRSAFNKEASEMYSEAWNRWLSELCRVDPNHKRDDHTDTLAISGGSKRSPVGAAFTVLYTVLRNRLNEIIGDLAFVVDEDGNESFSPEWSDTLNAYVCAIMGYGVEDFMSDSEKNIMSKAWRETFE